MIVAPGAVDVTAYFKLVDPITGVPVTGATITNLDATYVRDRAAAVKNDLTALATAYDAHSDNKAIVVDATNAPGLYRVDWPDAAFAAGVDRVQLVVNGAAIDPAIIEVELAPWLTLITGAGVNANMTQIGGQVASAAAPVAFPAAVGTSTYAGADTAGTTELLTRIPNASPGTVGGLPTVDAANMVAGVLALGAQAKLDVNAEVDTALNTAMPGSPTADSVNALVKAIAATSGAGDVSAISHTITVQDGSGVLSGVLVQISTDSGKINVIRSGSTNDLGQVTFLLDAGTYYAWSSRAETDFTNPVTVTVA